MSDESALGSFWKSFGPGLLWAGAAIGVSHLVQSTRAGADAGFALSGVILMALLLKYPFFEYGPRYAAATGESLVEGYGRVGRWAVWLYLLITLVTSIIVDGAILLFTGFLLMSVLGLAWPPWTAAGLLYVACAALLWVGRYRVLDRSIKAILIGLAISTLVAAAVALPRARLETFALVPDIGGPSATAVSFAFLLALMGWMPSAVDVSVWSSLWTLAKDESERVTTSVKHALLDFRVGYVGTGFMAFAFVTLGAAVMHGSGQAFSSAGPAFSLQLVDLYGETLGAWSRPFVLVAVLTTMLSTSLTVVDGFPRGIARSIEVLRGRPAADTETVRTETGRIYWLAIIAIGIAIPVLLALFGGALTDMVDFATIVSFLTAPVLGWLNLKAVTNVRVRPEFRPGRWLRRLSYVGLALLGGTGVVYFVLLLT